MWSRLRRVAGKKSARLPIRLWIEALEDRVVPDAAYHNLAGGNFSQDWADSGLITTNDIWDNVPSILGFLGQDITTATGTDPQTLLGTSGVANDLDVIANQNN